MYQQVAPKDVYVKNKKQNKRKNTLICSEKTAIYYICVCIHWLPSVWFGDHKNQICPYKQNPVRSLPTDFSDMFLCFYVF